MARRRRFALPAGFSVTRLEDRLAPAVVADLAVWQASGPAPIADSFSRVAATPTSPANATSGSIVALAPDPVDANRLWAASPNGGIWRTTDATAASPTWANLTDRLASQSFASLDLDAAPNGERRLLAGTGAVSDSGFVGDRVGLYYTDDAAGANPLFRLVQGGTVVNYSAPFASDTFVFDPVQGKFVTKTVTIQAAVTATYPQGAFVESDIWSVATRSFTPGPGAAQPTATSYLLAASDRGVFIAYRLSDGSLTDFTPLSGIGGLPTPVVQQSFGGPFGAPTFQFATPFNPRGITDLTVDPADPRRVYAAGQYGVFRTNDITAANPVWVSLGAVLTAGAGLPATTPLISDTTSRVRVAVHGGLTGPTDPNVAYVGVVNPVAGTKAARVTILWSDDQAGLDANGAKVGSPFAGSFTLMDEPVQLSVDLRLNGVGQITDATQAKPIVINALNVGPMGSESLNNGDRVLVEGVQGNAAANGVFTVSNAAKDNFTLEGSAATGKFVPGTGVLRKVMGLFPVNNSALHFSLAADPIDPSVVYVGGYYYDIATYTGGRSGFDGSGVLLRGNRSRPFLNGAITQAIIDADTTFQWTPLTDNKAAYLVGGLKTGTLEFTSPPVDSRVMVFDARNNLLEANDGGVFRRVNPRQNGRLDPSDPTEPATASDNKWVSVNGNLQVGEFFSIGFDPLSRQSFGSTFNTGLIAQPTGGGNLPPAAGSRQWQTDFGNTGTLGDGGRVFAYVVATDTLSVPGQTIRYNETTRLVYDAAGQLLEVGFLNLGSVGDTGPNKGLIDADKTTPLVIGPNRTRPAVPGVPSPAAGQVLIGGNNLYEDNDPNDPTGFIVGNVTPAGFAGEVTSLVYGGRQPGAGGQFVPAPRVAYVATDAGQLWVRRSAGGFVEVSGALAATVTASGRTATPISVLSVVNDPDDWRIAYVLRRELETITFTTTTGGPFPIPVTRTTQAVRERVYRTRDGGVSFTDITGSLIAPGVVDPVSGTIVGRIDAQGNPVNGLTTELYTLALFDGDPTQAGFVGGQATNKDVLFAGGRGGVFRLSSLPDGKGGRLPEAWTEFGTALPNVPVSSLALEEYRYDFDVTDATGKTVTQTLRGVGMVAGTVGRGSYVIADVNAPAAVSGQPLASAPANVTVNGNVQDVDAAGNPAFDRRGNPLFTAGTVRALAGAISADVNNPAFVTVSDGVSSTTFERSTIQGFDFKGTAALVDSVQVLAGSQAGGDLNFVRFPVRVDLGNSVGDAVRVSNGTKATPTVVTIGTVALVPEVTGQLPPVAQRVGFGPNDNLFDNARGGSLQLRGLDQGRFILDLGTGSAKANSVFVQGTKARTTQVVGGVGVASDPTKSDAIVVSSTAGFFSLPVLDPVTGKQAIDPATGKPVFAVQPGAVNGNLNDILGDLLITGPAAAAGRYTLRLNDQAGAGNNGVVFGRDASAGLGTVLNLGGPTGTAAVRYDASVGDLNVVGSDVLGVNQTYTVADPLAPLTLFTGNGPATLNIQSLSRTADLRTGAGNDLIRVSSRAGLSNDGDLSQVLVPLLLEAGAGDNRLVVSNAGSPVATTVTITRNVIVGASPGDITYKATGGRFLDPAGGPGVLYQGSNRASDVITLRSAAKNSQTTIDGLGGPDSITAFADDLELADVRLVGGGGGDTITLDQQLFGLRANSLAVVGSGTDTFVVQGYDQQFRTDFADLRIDGNGSGAAFVDGGLTAATFSGVARLAFDGKAGINNLTLTDNTSTAFGTPADPASGVVYAPLGEASGEFRFAARLPVVAFTRVTGLDDLGLVYNGDPSGTGTFADTLTVVGPSEDRLGGSGVLAGAVSGGGGNTITVSDRRVVFEQSGAGPLRTLTLARVNDRPTVSNLVILAGDTADAGDTVTVFPSRDTNILVDGQGPSRSGVAGNVLLVGGDSPYTLSSTANPALGGPQVRVETADGGSFGYRNFGRVGGTSSRSIYAVGADVGGGPRVRVYDALTGQVLFDRFVYEPTFTGGVRVATGDVTGDGVPDLIVAAGPGGGPRVSVYDGVGFDVISSFFAYEPTFTGGLYLAVGDLDADGVSEVVTGTGVGGGPLVKAFDRTGRQLTAVFAFEQTFRGGVRVAVGDVTGDGKADLITTAGPGGGPIVRVFDPTTLRPVQEFFAGDASLRTGLSVAAGDLDGDGLAEVIVGPASGPVSEATVFRADGSTVSVPLFTDQEADPTPAPTGVLNDTGGVRLAVADSDADGEVQVILAARGPGFPSRVYRYFIDPVQEAGNAQAFEDEFVGGVWIG